MTLKKFLLLFYSIFLCVLTIAQEPIDTTKGVFFLDNKQVFAKVIYTEFENDPDRLEFRSGAISTRDILLWFGEKYRNYDSISVFITRKRDDEESN